MEAVVIAIIAVVGLVLIAGVVFAAKRRRDAELERRRWEAERQRSMADAAAADAAQAQRQAAVLRAKADELDPDVEDEDADTRFVGDSGGVIDLRDDEDAHHDTHRRERT
jgi:hypothetical protein